MEAGAKCCLFFTTISFILWDESGGLWQNGLGMKRSFAKIPCANLVLCHEGVLFNFYHTRYSPWFPAQYFLWLRTIGNYFCFSCFMTRIPERGQGELDMKLMIIAYKIWLLINSPACCSRFEKNRKNLSCLWNPSLKLCNLHISALPLSFSQYLEDFE